MSFATFSCASSVDAPRCGVHTRLGWASSAFSEGSLFGGSVEKTSNAAPAMWPDSRPLRRAASLMIPPLAQLMTRTPALHLAMVSSFNKSLVWGVSGVWKVMKSLLAHMVSREACVMPKSSKTSGSITGSYPNTVMPIALAPSATTCPILPHPTMPMVLPCSSTPVKFFFTHLPALTDASAAGMCLAKLAISDKASCAVLIVFPPGVFITMMPFL